MEVAVDSEKDLITDPTLHYLDFAIQKIAVGPEVHGVSFSILRS